MRFGLLLILLLFAGCQGERDLVDESKKPSPSSLDLEPLHVAIEPTLLPVIKEELYGRWKITSLNNWGSGDDIWFTDDTTLFSFRCNQMSVSGKLSSEGKWHVPLESFATTEAGCQGEKGEQDKALLSLMIGPTNIERIGTSLNGFKFFTDDHVMMIERIGSGSNIRPLSNDVLIGQWDVLRFDDFVPKSRLNVEGKRWASVDFYKETRRRNALAAGLYIGCNGSGNAVRLNIETWPHALDYVPIDHDRVRTDMGCSPEQQLRDNQFFELFLQSPKIMRLGEYRLRLWIDEHELILEKSEFGQIRNQIRDFKMIEGKWHITMVNNAGYGLGGNYFTPEPLVISKSKIQYGDISPYLKTPTIWGGKIKGNVVGNLAAHNCGEYPSTSLTGKEAALKEYALCVVLRVMTGEPIAEPTHLPDQFQLTLDDYRLTLVRAEALNFSDSKIER